MSLNAPFGARCFMTFFQGIADRIEIATRLNAPFGARCFMTVLVAPEVTRRELVLMHRLALGAL